MNDNRYSETKWVAELHADGSATCWNSFKQGWQNITSISDEIGQSHSEEERQAILGHFFRYGKGVARCKCGAFMNDHNLAGEAVQFCSAECRDEAATTGSHVINIATWRGKIIQVDGLPDGWEFTVHDVEQDDSH